MSGGGERGGGLAIVLHTHMPYVEGYGTWPFGEEWLWEAIAGSYLPLLDLLDEGAPLTLSLTPVLCDQLEAPGVAERFADFVEGTRRLTHQEDAAGLRAAGHEQLARELERSLRDYEQALEGLRRRGGDLLGAFARHAQWTSAATHAVLPLLASDAGVCLQVQTGVSSHRRRFDDWRGGFWLPECAYAPWLERVLEDCGVAAACVELTGPLGLGAAEHLRPLVTDSGVLLVPIDRSTVSLVWDERGYPAHGAYRDYHHHTVHHHNAWNNAGGAYDPDEALALSRAHAADFVARTRARMRTAAQDAGASCAPALVVCALDTELLGHWWYEGIAWLRAVVEECSLQGLALVRLDDAIQRLEPVPMQLQGWVGSWGEGGDLSTWSGPAVADMTFAARAAELEVLAAGEVSARATRELLALQASDWPFMVTRGLAGPYPRERFEGHRRALAAALAADAAAGARGREPDASTESTRGPRNLAVDADPGQLLIPV